MHLVDPHAAGALDTGRGATELLAAGPVTVATIAALRAATHELADRFTGGDGTTGVFEVDLGAAGRLTMDVDAHGCHVAPHGTNRATARMRTDAATWIGICDGTVDPISAFLDGRLEADGDLHAAVRLETLFAPAPGQQRSARRAVRTRTSRSVEIASLVAGSGTPVVLLHGLAANLLSFLPTFVALAEHHEVHVLDLPGFGRSSKPAPHGDRYHPTWMAHHVQRYVEAHGLGPVHLVGNSMGGRISHEVALARPDLVRSVTGLCPAVAFDALRPVQRLLDTTRAQWAGITPVRIPRAVLERFVEELFHNPARVPAANMRVAAGDAHTMLRDRGYRLATAAAARHLGAARSRGRDSYWQRIARIEVPTFWIFGKQDILVPGGYAHRVRRVLPSAQVELWDALGHVPQFERPHETHAAIRRFVGRLDRADEAMRAIGAR